jgi:hypothetical protein
MWQRIATECQQNGTKLHVISQIEKSFGINIMHKLYKYKLEFFVNSLNN